MVKDTDRKEVKGLARAGPRNSPHDFSVTPVSVLDAPSDLIDENPTFDNGPLKGTPSLGLTDNAGVIAQPQLVDDWGRFDDDDAEGVGAGSLPTTDCANPGTPPDFPIAGQPDEPWAGRVLVGDEPPICGQAAGPEADNDGLDNMGQSHADAGMAMSDSLDNHSGGETSEGQRTYSPIR